LIKHIGKKSAPFNIAQHHQPAKRPPQPSPRLSQQQVVIALTSQNYPAFWTQDPEGWFEFLDHMYRIDHVWLRKPKNALCSSL
jgi:hypothetical protein